MNQVLINYFNFLISSGNLLNSNVNFFLKKTAFYHSLRDTLVANNLEQANRIAYGKERYRVVTLDGNLIDKSGAMSGGGTKVSRGGMSSSFTPDYSQEVII